MLVGGLGETPNVFIKLDRREVHGDNFSESFSSFSLSPASLKGVVKKKGARQYEYGF